MIKINTKILLDELDLHALLALSHGLPLWAWSTSSWRRVVSFISRLVSTNHDQHNRDEYLDTVEKI